MTMGSRSALDGTAAPGSGEEVRTATADDIDMVSPMESACSDEVAIERPFLDAPPALQDPQRPERVRMIRVASHVFGGEAPRHLLVDQRGDRRALPQDLV